MRNFIEKIQAMGEVPVDETSDLVLDFYQSMSDRVDSHNLYKGENAGRIWEWGPACCCSCEN